MDIPSSVHEWLYIEDRGTFTKSYVTEMLRAVNQEVVAEEEFLSDDFIYEGRGFSGLVRRNRLTLLRFQTHFKSRLSGLPGTHLRVPSFER